MKMIGNSIRSTATRFCKSRPLRSGRATSSTRQLGASTGGRRNSCAVANVSGCQPALEINNSSDSRTETSSSTMNTIGMVCEVSDDLDSRSATLTKLMFVPLHPLGRKSTAHRSVHSKSGIERPEQSYVAEWLEQTRHGT